MLSIAGQEGCKAFLPLKLAVFTAQITLLCCRSP